MNLSDEIKRGIPNLSNHSYQQIQQSRLQSHTGEWHCFLGENITDKVNLSAIDTDYIWLVTPAKESNKTRGYRIAYQAIENVIEQLIGVNQAIVFGVPHEQKGNAIHLYVELANSHIALDTLSNAINAKLIDCIGTFACPDTIKFIEKPPAIKNKDDARKTLKFQDLTISCAA